MIQDIQPSKFHIEYKHDTCPPPNAPCFVFDNSAVLCGSDYALPRFSELETKTAVYLFKIDNTEYYLADGAGKLPEGFSFISAIAYEHKADKKSAFAAMTAYHLYMWYRDHRYCGRCQSALVADSRERMMKCPKCGNSIYPKISPAIIVAVKSKDRLLLSRYRGRSYKGFSLIAGFVEAGESAEDTVCRELAEEVGIKVKNIRYYGSQPWGQESNLLIGYTAELDGDDTINMDSDELSSARWYSREEIDFIADNISLTSEMIIAFKDGKF